MNFFKNITEQERRLRGESDPEKAIQDAFADSDDANFSDLETLLDKYCFPKASQEGEGWDNFKMKLTRIKEGTGNFFKALVRGGKATVNTVAAIKNRVSDFVSSMINSIKDKVVTEQYIHEKFGKVARVVEESQNMRDYVRNVPEYDTLIKRLNGIISSANYIKSLASAPDAPDGKTLMQQLEVKSKGVVKAVLSGKETAFANLEWVEADLHDFDIKSSKYGNKKDLDTLKNLILHCKYEATDDLMAAAKAIDKRAKEESGDESADAGNYALVYSVGKVTKQFYKEAIQKEINMIATVYCTRLAKLESR